MPESDKEMDRGQRAKEMDRGFGGAADSASIATDLFQRASQLGGLLVVALVAPVGPTGGATGLTAAQRALLGLAESTAAKQPALAAPTKETESQQRGLQARRQMLSGGD